LQHLYAAEGLRLQQGRLVFARETEKIDENQKKSTDPTVAILLS
jgi:hypothetical protein